MFGFFLGKKRGFWFFFLLFDKPFGAEDFIVFDSEKDRIEKLVKNQPEIQAPTGEGLVVSNRELTEKKI